MHLSECKELFKTKHFNVCQKGGVFKVGTDALLLGSLIPVIDQGKVLEVGSGTGIISLLYAQRSKAHITALDIEKEAAELSAFNFNESSFSQRLQAIQGDLRNWETLVCFDHIFSNPPFFMEDKTNGGLRNARQQVKLNHSDLLIHSKRLLSENGHMTVILPYDYRLTFCIEALSQEFRLKEEIIIYSKSRNPERVILHFSKKLLYNKHSSRRTLRIWDGNEHSAEFRHLMYKVLTHYRDYKLII